MNVISKVTACFSFFIAALATPFPVAAMEVTYSMKYTIGYAGEPSTPTNYHGSAFDVGSIYVGKLSFDDLDLNGNGYQVVQVSSFELNLASNNLYGFRSELGLVQNYVGMVIENGQLVDFKNFGLYGPGDMTYIDFHYAHFVSAPSGYDFYAKLYALDFNQFATIDVAGTLEIERIPEPASVNLIFAGLLSFFSPQELKRAEKNRALYSVSGQRPHLAR